MLAPAGAGMLAPAGAAAAAVPNQHCETASLCRKRRLTKRITIFAVRHQSLR